MLKKISSVILILVFCLSQTVYANEMLPPEMSAEEFFEEISNEIPVFNSSKYLPDEISSDESLLENLPNEKPNEETSLTTEYLVKYKESTILKEVSSKSRGIVQTSEYKENVENVFEEQLSQMSQDNIEVAIKGELLSDNSGSVTKLLSIESNEDSEYVIAQLLEMEGVEYAEPNYKVKAATAAYFDMQWGLNPQPSPNHNGQYHINVMDVWPITYGSPNVIIGVIDTGMNVNHIDLAPNIVAGWNFIDDNNVVWDSNNPNEYSHGTSVAGIIAAYGQGITGVAPNVKMMPLKALGGIDDAGTMYHVIKAVEYAEEHGVKIVNCSFESDGYSQFLYNAINQSDMLFVCAAGNGGNDFAQSKSYPAGYGLNNIISVAAMTSSGNLITTAGDSSNYGEGVHIAAPGLNIATTLVGGNYGYQHGTSMAAPFVTGVAALIKSVSPELSASEIKSRILLNAKPLNSLIGKVDTNGYLNAAAAFKTTVEPADLPSPSRYGGGYITANGALYAIGGYDGNSFLNNLDIFNSVTGSWQSYLLPSQYKTAEMSVELYGDNIYAFGGTNGSTAINTVFKLNTKTLGSSYGANMPEELYASASVVLGNKAYIIGGMTDDGYSSKVFSYDFTNDTWATEADFQFSFAYGKAVAVNGVIYVIGGTNGYNCIDGIYEYNPTTGKTFLKTELQTPRKDFGVTVFDGKVYIFGGSVSHDARGRNALLGKTESTDIFMEVITDTIERFDVYENVCETVGVLDNAVTGISAVKYFNRTYLIGGWDGNYRNNVKKYFGLSFPQNLRINTNNTDTEFTANWNEVDGATEYQVEIYGTVYTKTVTNHTFSLGSNLPYDIPVRVRAVKGSEYSLWSDMSCFSLNGSLGDAKKLTYPISITDKLYESEQIKWYSISSGTPGIATFTLSNVPNGCEYVIQLRDSAGEVIETSLTTISNIAIEEYNYFITVTSINGGSASNAYTLSGNFTPIDENAIPDRVKATISRETEIATSSMGEDDMGFPQEDDDEPIFATFDEAPTANFDSEICVDDLSLVSDEDLYFAVIGQNTNNSSSDLLESYELMEDEMQEEMVEDDSDDSEGEIFDESEDADIEDEIIVGTQELENELFAPAFEVFNESYSDSETYYEVNDYIQMSEMDFDEYDPETQGLSLASANEPAYTIYDGMQHPGVGQFVIYQTGTIPANTPGSGHRFKLVASVEPKNAGDEFEVCWINTQGYSDVSGSNFMQAPNQYNGRCYTAAILGPSSSLRTYTVAIYWKTKSGNSNGGHLVRLYLIEDSISFEDYNSSSKPGNDSPTTTGADLVSLSINSPVTINGKIDHPEDLDFFRINVPANNKLIAYVASPSGKTYYTSIWDGNSRIENGWLVPNGGKAGAEICNKTGSAQNYYVLVHGMNDQYSLDEYQLTLTRYDMETFADLLPNNTKTRANTNRTTFENNYLGNTTTEATPITFSVDSMADMNYYAVQMNTGDKLSIHMDMSLSPSYVDFLHKYRIAVDNGLLVNNVDVFDNPTTKEKYATYVATRTGVHYIQIGSRSLQYNYAMKGKLTITKTTAGNLHGNEVKSSGVYRATNDFISATLPTGKILCATKMTSMSISGHFDNELDIDWYQYTHTGATVNASISLSPTLSVGNRFGYIVVDDNLKTTSNGFFNSVSLTRGQTYYIGVFVKDGEYTNVTGSQANRNYTLSVNINALFTMNNQAVNYNGSANMPRNGSNTITFTFDAQNAGNPDCKIELRMGWDKDGAKYFKADQTKTLINGATNTVTFNNVDINGMNGNVLYAQFIIYFQNGDVRRSQLFSKPMSSSGNATFNKKIGFTVPDSNKKVNIYYYECNPEDIIIEPTSIDGLISAQNWANNNIFGTNASFYSMTPPIYMSVLHVYNDEDMSFYSGNSNLQGYTNNFFAAIYYTGAALGYKDKMGEWGKYPSPYNQGIAHMQWGIGGVKLMTDTKFNEGSDFNNEIKKDPDLKERDGDPGKLSIATSRTAIGYRDGRVFLVAVFGESNKLSGGPDMFDMHKIMGSIVGTSQNSPSICLDGSDKTKISFKDENDSPTCVDNNTGMNNYCRIRLTNSAASNVKWSN